MTLKSVKCTSSCDKKGDQGPIIENRDLAALYLSQGGLALLKGELINGMSLFDKAVELDPNHAESFYRQGLFLFEYGSAKGNEKIILIAAKKFKIATDINPAYFEAWQTWGNALLFLGDLHKEHHYYLKAKEKFEQAIGLGGKNDSDVLSELYWDYGIVSMRIGKHSKEMEDFQFAINAFQISSNLRENLPEEFWNDFGLAYLEMAQCFNHDLSFIIKAIHCFERTVAIKITSFEGWLFLAKSASLLYTYTQDEDHFIQASECFSAASHLKPNDKNLSYDWACALLNAGKNTRDPKKLRLAVEKAHLCSMFDPQNGELLATQAEGLSVLAEVTDSIDLVYEAQNKIVEAVALSGVDNIEVLYAHAQCLFSFASYFQDLDLYYQSIEKHQEVTSLNRTRHESWYEMAKIYAIVGNRQNDVGAFERSVYFYVKALTLKPLNHYYFGYASALSRLGEIKRDKTLIDLAITYFEHLLQIQKNLLYAHPEWLFQYAIALNLLGDFSEEEGCYQKALDTLSQILMINPSFPNVHYQIGLTYACLGDTLRVSHYFHRAIHHFRLALKQEESYPQVVFLDWAIALISIGEGFADHELGVSYYREAEFKLMQAARLGNEEAFYQLGCLYSLLKDPQKAIFFLEKAHHAEALPLVEELLNDEWLEFIRVLPSFQEFLSHLSQG